jgi:hypothetical protein
MNELLKMGFAFVDKGDDNGKRDIQLDADEVIGIRFAGGGALHLRMSSLDLLAFRVVRTQLNADATRERVAA